MALSKLMLLDSVVIIKLFELGLWDVVLKRYEVHISEIIIDETKFYYDDENNRISINLKDFIPSSQIHTVEINEVNQLKNLIGINILERIDPGEAELLTVLHNSLEDFYICTGDIAVFRTLPLINKSDKSISLEEVLDHCGRLCKLPLHYTKKAREVALSKGFADKIQGLTTKRE